MFENWDHIVQGQEDWTNFFLRAKTSKNTMINGQKWNEKTILR